mmetsp:Transcript_69913/g.166883  ORF Transcript_69913/g.166883 Transcript_69913/m.166883 type:complete len:330 (-) Transcript_69913:678-1667(-)
MHVNPFGLAFHSLTAIYEFTQRDSPRAITIQQISQHLGIARSEPNDVKVRIHDRILQQMLDFCQADCSITIQVCGDKKLDDLIKAHPLLFERFFNLNLPLLLGILHCVVHKDACEDIQQGQNCENDVSKHQAERYDVHTQQGIRHFVPTDAAQGRLKKGVHTSRDVTEEAMNLSQLLAVAVLKLLLPVRIGKVDVNLYPICTGARERDGKDIHDEEEHQEGPQELFHRIRNHESKRCQLPEEAKDSEEANHSDHLQHPDAGERCGSKTHQQQNHIQNTDAHEKEVAYIPPAVFTREEGIEPVRLEPDGNLHNEPDTEEDAACKEHRRWF